jgi:tripartite-type tricarboxylate transporter receptor subunit TctC
MISMIDRLTAGMLLTVTCGIAAAQGVYPAKPVRLVLPYPPGGGTDVIARPLAAKLSETLGQQFVVENRGGAGGNIGMESVARAPADGYTIVMALTAQLAVNPSLYPKLPYDPVRDFAPITQLGSAPYVMLVHPTLPSRTVKEFIAIAKSRPDELTFASAGNGSGAHLAGELLKSMTGVRLTHVPYKGAGPSLPDLIAGQVQSSFITYTSAGPQIRAGRVRAIGVTTLKRSPALPDVPAISETVAGYDSGVWYGVLAPAGTPRDIVMKLNAEINRALNAPDVRPRLTSEAMEPSGTTPEALGDHMKAEIAKWARVVKESGAKVD